MYIEPQILRIHEICRVVGLSKPTVYREMKRGTFPPPIRLGVCAVGMIVARKRGIEARFSRF